MRQLSDAQRVYLRALIGRRVQFNAAGNIGRIVSVVVTSDGFIIGRTKPGEDRGIFIGRLPEESATVR